jgi:hypothetical protein
LIGNEVVHATTYDAAVKAALNEPRFDVYFLDHDLNDFGQRSVGPAASMYGGIRELTGHDFATFILRELPAEQYPDTFVVHSFNPGGAENMVRTLRQTGVKVVRELFHPEIGEAKGR